MQLSEPVLVDLQKKEVAKIMQDRKIEFEELEKIRKMLA